MTSLGVKEITPANWLEIDEVVKQFVRVSAEGIVPMTCEDWLQPILKPRLIETVPEEVQKLFEVARGAMVYAYFFYPLYGLAVEQLHRVVEAAVTHKCEQLGAPRMRTFANRIDWLKKNEVISSSEYDELDRLRVARNIASHPTDQTILTPGIAIHVLEGIAETIKDLFRKP